MQHFSHQNISFCFELCLQQNVSFCLQIDQIRIKIKLFHSASKLSTMEKLQISQDFDLSKTRSKNNFWFNITVIKFKTLLKAKLKDKCITVISKKDKISPCISPQLSLPAIHKLLQSAKSNNIPHKFDQIRSDRSKYNILLNNVLSSKYNKTPNCMQNIK